MSALAELTSPGRSLASFRGDAMRSRLRENSIWPRTVPEESGVVALGVALVIVVNRHVQRNALEARASLDPRNAWERSVKRGSNHAKNTWTDNEGVYKPTMLGPLGVSRNRGRGG
jgi:hypothetical protein